MEARLSKVTELEEGIPEAEMKRNSLAKLIAQKGESIPIRAKEAMERDLTNLT